MGYFAPILCPKERKALMKLHMASWKEADNKTGCIVISKVGAFPGEIVDFDEYPVKRFIGPIHLAFKAAKVEARQAYGAHWDVVSAFVYPEDEVTLVYPS